MGQSKRNLEQSIVELKRYWQAYITQSDASNITNHCFEHSLNHLVRTSVFYHYQLITRSKSSSSKVWAEMMKPDDFAELSKLALIVHSWTITIEGHIVGVRFGGQHMVTKVSATALMEYAETLQKLIDDEPELSPDAVFADRRGEEE
jgi:hypothetical protein